MVKDLDPERQPRRRLGEGTGSFLRAVFFILGSVLNLLAVLILVGNIFNMSRLWLSGGTVVFEPVMLAPLGAFLAGVICFLIAIALD